MVLDRLLAHLTVEVEPLAVCQLSDGWRVRLPVPPRPLVHFVLEGSGVIRGPRDEPHAVAPSWIALVPRGARHALESGAVEQEVLAVEPAPGDGFCRIDGGPRDRAALVVACGLVTARYGGALSLFEHLHEVIVVDVSDRTELRVEFTTVLAEQEHHGPGHGALATALMTQCLVYVLRELTRRADASAPWLAALDDPRLARAIDGMIIDPSAHHTVASLANSAAMSRSAFAEHFTAALGCTPMALLQRVRMHRAAQLLQQNATLSVDEVASRVGYASRSHFAAVFRKHHGMLPAGFRSAPVATPTRAP